MMTPTLRGLLTLLCLTASAALAQAAEWGTISGRIVYDGKAPDLEPLKVDKEQEVCGKSKPSEKLVEAADGGMQNAVIWLRTPDKIDVAPMYASTETADVVLDNTKCQFVPHIVVMTTSQTLVIKNSDPVGHNTNVMAQVNAAFNNLIPGGTDIRKKMDKAEKLPDQVGCNIHPWMGAWLVVRPNPYAAVTDANGKFTIADLPAGKELEFQLWQETSGFLKEAKNKDVKVDKSGRFKITVKPGATDLGDFMVSPAVFKGKLGGS